MKYRDYLSKPDLDELCFIKGIGEFSVRSDEAFEKHLKRLAGYNEKFKHLNGNRMEAILRQEKLWLGVKANIFTYQQTEFNKDKVKPR